MRTIHHREQHFQGGNTIRDIVIGMSDGLTAPFALVAGISGAIALSAKFLQFNERMIQQGIFERSLF